MSEKTKNKKPLAVLLIGPLPPPIGGGPIVFQNIVDDLRKDNRCNITVINTSRSIERGDIINNVKVSFRVFVKLLTLIRAVDIVSFHASNRGLSSFGPLIFIVCHLFGKPSVFRFFGGAFDVFFEKRSKFGRWFLKRTVLSVDACLFQTRSLKRYFQDHGVKNAVWFSNYTRNIPTLPVKLSRKTCSRYVFLGRIMRQKGVDVILDAVPFLFEKVTIDLWGPLCDGYTAEEISIRGCGRVQYCGTLSKEEIFDTLWEYDAIVLPTCFTTEGYPGVILDGFSHGLPIISTRMGAIPEIVDDTCGLLIEHSDAHDFARAVNLLHKEVDLFSRLRYGSFERAQKFSDVHWAEIFVKLLQKAVDKNR